MPVKKQVFFNDPIYDFIAIQDPLILELINHPYFQRLQRIKQLALTGMVFPGAMHTRFQHAIGAMHLTKEAIQVLISKGVKVSDQELRGVLIAILLHDIGHGPFSHTLEEIIIQGVSHEDITELFLEKLNKEFFGKLGIVIQIFTNTYKKKFLHQLVSSQLDMDRLDYLNRDSFFTGVSEGIINSNRIIKTLNVKNDELVVDIKGIYSIEKFIISRRLMYWQVYLHKTVLSAEYLLMNIIKRAKELAHEGEELFTTPALRIFLYTKFSKKDFKEQPKLLDYFAQLDDTDIYASVKTWMMHKDYVLSTLSKNLVNRNLYKVVIQNKPFSEKLVDDLKAKVIKKYKLMTALADYFVFTREEFNDAYRPDKIRISVLDREGNVTDITQTSDPPYLTGLHNTVKKYFLCYPKDIIL